MTEKEITDEKEITEQFARSVREIGLSLVKLSQELEDGTVEPTAAVEWSDTDRQVLSERTQMFVDQMPDAIWEA